MAPQSHVDVKFVAFEETFNYEGAAYVAIGRHILNIVQGSLRFAFLDLPPKTVSVYGKRVDSSLVLIVVLMTLRCHNDDSRGFSSTRWISDPLNLD